MNFLDPDDSKGTRKNEKSKESAYAFIFANIICFVYRAIMLLISACNDDRKKVFENLR